MAKELTAKQRIAFRVMTEALGLFSLRLRRYALVYVTRGALPPTAELNNLIELTSRKVSKSISDAMIDEFKQITGGVVDNSNQFVRGTRTLDALIRDKQITFQNHLLNATRVLENDFGIFDSIAERVLERPGANLLGSGTQVGRRLSDAVRQTSMQTIENAIVQGRGRASLVGEIRESLRPMQTLRADGRAGITIMVRPYDNIAKTRTYDLKKYSELVALTTTREAEQQGHLSRADQLGTSLMKYNFFNKSYDDDPVCKRINGRIYSLQRGGEFVGKYYAPYIKGPQGIPGEFNTAHPRCRHVARPISFEAAEIELKRKRAA